VHRRSAPPVTQRTIRVRTSDSVRLRAFGEVRAVDFRGHGRSGGGAVLRQAVLGEHRPDAVVSVSAVSRWYADVWAVPDMGHGESGTTAPLVERIGRWAIGAVAGLGPRGSASIGR
jgi:hypothetical protein